jgi:hypothetical protein
MPDLNPIEQLLSKVKALVRKAARSLDAVCNAIATALAAVSNSECANYFKNSGYSHNKTGNALAESMDGSRSVREPRDTQCDRQSPLISPLRVISMRFGGRGESARSQHGNGDRVGERKGGGGSPISAKVSCIGRTVPRCVVARRRDEGRGFRGLAKEDQNAHGPPATLGRPDTKRLL